MGHTPADDGREVFAAVLGEPLDGGDFLLRRAREDDVPPIMALVEDGDALGRLRPPTFDVAMARQMVLHGGTLIIADAASDAPLGGIRLFLHGDAVEFGYWLGADARGRGLVTRALTLVADAVVSRLRPSRLELRTTIGNDASERVAARAGFERVGPEPPIEHPDGRVIESTLWILVPAPT